MARFYHGIGVQYSVSYGPFLTMFLFYGSFCFTAASVLRFNIAPA